MKRIPFKKNQEWLHNDIITNPIFMKFTYNQSDLSFNISTKFHQNPTHNNQNISCKSGTDRPIKFEGATVSQTVMKIYDIYVCKVLWINRTKILFILWYCIDKLMCIFHSDWNQFYCKCIWFRHCVWWIIIDSVCSFM